MIISAYKINFGINLEYYLSNGARKEKDKG